MIATGWSHSRHQPRGILRLYPPRFSCCSYHTPPRRDLLTDTCLDARAAIPMPPPAIPKEEASSHSLRGARGDTGQEAKEENCSDRGLHNFPPRHRVRMHDIKHPHNRPGAGAASFSQGNGSGRVLSLPASCWARYRPGETMVPPGRKTAGFPRDLLPGFPTTSEQQLGPAFNTPGKLWPSALLHSTEPPGTPQRAPAG